jgi:hypothetical protein
MAPRPDVPIDSLIVKALVSAYGIVAVDPHGDVLVTTGDGRRFRVAILHEATTPVAPLPASAPLPPDTTWLGPQN